jgi:hypothetical protein
MLPVSNPNMVERQPIPKQNPSDAPPPALSLPMVNPNMIPPAPVPKSQPSNTQSFEQKPPDGFSAIQWNNVKKAFVDNVRGADRLNSNDIEEVLHRALQMHLSQQDGNNFEDEAMNMLMGVSSDHNKGERGARQLAINRSQRKINSGKIDAGSVDPTLQRFDERADSASRAFPAVFGDHQDIKSMEKAFDLLGQGKQKRQIFLHNHELMGQALRDIMNERQRDEEENQRRRDALESQDSDFHPVQNPNEHVPFAQFKHASVERYASAFSDLSRTLRNFFAR